MFTGKADLSVSPFLETFGNTRKRHSCAVAWSVALSQNPWHGVAPADNSFLSCISPSKLRRRHESFLNVNSEALPPAKLSMDTAKQFSQDDREPSLSTDVAIVGALYAGVAAAVAAAKKGFAFSENKSAKTNSSAEHNDDETSQVAPAQAVSKVISSFSSWHRKFWCADFAPMNAPELTLSLQFMGQLLCASFTNPDVYRRPLCGFSFCPADAPVLQRLANDAMMAVVPLGPLAVLRPQVRPIHKALSLLATGLYTWITFNYDMNGDTLIQAWTNVGIFLSVAADGVTGPGITSSFLRKFVFLNALGLTYVSSGVGKLNSGTFIQHAGLALDLCTQHYYPRLHNIMPSSFGQVLAGGALLFELLGAPMALSIESLRPLFYLSGLSMHVGIEMLFPNFKDFRTTICAYQLFFDLPGVPDVEKSKTLLATVECDPVNKDVSDERLDHSEDLSERTQARAGSEILVSNLLAAAGSAVTVLFLYGNVNRTLTRRIFHHKVTNHHVEEPSSNLIRACLSRS